MARAVRMGRVSDRHRPVQAVSGVHVHRRGVPVYRVLRFRVAVSRPDRIHVSRVRDRRHDAVVEPPVDR